MSSASIEPLRWQASPLARRLALLAGAALVVALVTHVAEFVAFAAPLLGALAVVGMRPRPDVLEVRLEPDTARCFEGEDVTFDLVARLPAGGEELVPRITVSEGVELVEHTVTALPDGVRAEWVLRAPRWGRFVLPVTVTATAGAGLLAARVEVAALQVRVYPRPGPQKVPLRSSDLPDRIGAHIARRRGEGVEFAGIRPYVPGDQLRMVNWAASARRGRLHVTERLTERAADVITLIDTYSAHSDTTASPAVEAAVDLAVHGTAQVVNAALRRGDRAGVIALGGRLRWLRADLGRTQFYRIVDAVLDAYPSRRDRHDDRPGHTDLIPRGVLPSAALVVAFTPLLDGRIVLPLYDVRLRGHGVLVVDVLRDIPHPDPASLDPLVARVWRMERSSMHRHLAALGIPVVPWPAGTALDEVLTPLMRRPLPAQRPSP